MVNVSSIIVFYVIVTAMIYRPRLVAHNALLCPVAVGSGEKKRKTKSRTCNRYYCFTTRFINIIIIQSVVGGNIRV